VALIQGLAGVGKTSLAAEMVHLGFERFDYVLAFQAKGVALGIEELYQGLDFRLAKASKPYRERCQADEIAAVFLAPTDRLKGKERYEALAYNLVDAMSAERILLVLDNFETNLVPGTEGCADPAWERLLEILADRLGETGSRVMVTSRHTPAVLEGKALWIPLGALPIAEAKVHFQNHAVLSALWYEHLTRTLRSARELAGQAKLTRCCVLDDAHQAVSLAQQVARQVALARQALALRERLPDPEHRAASHNNLAVCLRATGSPDEARSHQLAAFVYRLVTGLYRRYSLRNLTIDIREAASRGERFDFPRLATLLADPAFAPLRTFLTERGDDLPALQTRIDQLVEEARATP
jgi:hypothetical protein